MPVHLPVPAVYPSTSASSSQKVFTLRRDFDLLFQQRDSGSRNMRPSPSILLTFSSSSKRSVNPLQTRWAWHLMQGLSISPRVFQRACIRVLKGFLRPGQSKTRYLTFFHQSSMGLFFLTADMVYENLPLPIKSQPSSWLFGQFLVKNLGGKKRLPFRENIAVPVQKQRTPSSFSLMIHPLGSIESPQVSASRTLMQAEVGGPSADLVSLKDPSPRSSLTKLRSLLASELFLLL